MPWGGYFSDFFERIAQIRTQAPTGGYSGVVILGYGNIGCNQIIALIVLIVTLFLNEAKSFSLFNATQILSIPIMGNPISSLSSLYSWMKQCHFICLMRRKFCAFRLRKLRAKMLLSYSLSLSSTSSLIAWMKQCPFLCLMRGIFCSSRFGKTQAKNLAVEFIVLIVTQCLSEVVVFFFDLMRFIF